MVSSTKKIQELIKQARSLNKFTSKELILHTFSDFFELHGDRLFGDDPAIIGGLAFLKDIPVTVIGIQKGKNLKENLKTNFGQAKPEGYYKALRLMKQAEKFNRPILTFINTPGAFCGLEAEKNGQGKAIADCLFFLSQCHVPVLSIIIGEGGSGGALALALADEVWMFEHSFYAILSPEGFASILWKDAKKAMQAAQLMKLSPQELYKQHICDRIIAETTDKKERLSLEELSEELKTQLYQTVTRLKALPLTERLEKRYARFRKF